MPHALGVTLSLAKFNRILSVDATSRTARVQCGARNLAISEAAAPYGLYYAPDPSSQIACTIGGNVAENAGGPRAFKYGTTKQYVLGLEAVLPTGEIVRTGGKVVKNVVGYDLTHLLVGSEGTLAIITQIVLRLVPRPPVQATLRATGCAVMR